VRRTTLTGVSSLNRDLIKRHGKRCEDEGLDIRSMNAPGVGSKNFLWSEKERE